MRTRYPLKVGFKHHRRKPAAVKTFLGLALNSRATKRLEVNFSDFTQASRKSKVSQDMDNDAEVHPPWGRNRKARVSRMPSGDCDKQDGDPEYCISSKSAWKRGSGGESNESPKLPPRFVPSTAIRSARNLSAPHAVESAAPAASSWSATRKCALSSALFRRVEVPLALK